MSQAVLGSVSFTIGDFDPFGSADMIQSSWLKLFFPGS
jgi:hypothetical protein